MTGYIAGLHFYSWTKDDQKTRTFHLFASTPSAEIFMNKEQFLEFRRRINDPKYEEYFDTPVCPLATNQLKG